jgi:hypothetical protein
LCAGDAELFLAAHKIDFALVNSMMVLVAFGHLVTVHPVVVSFAGDAPGRFPDEHTREYPILGLVVDG